MQDGEWHAVCHTCSVEHRSAEFGDANAFFERHAERSHDVKMRDLTLVDAIR